MLSNTAGELSRTAYTFTGIYNFANRSIQFYVENEHEFDFLCLFEDDFDFMVCYLNKNLQPEPCGKAVYFRTDNLDKKILLDVKLYY